MYVTFWEEPSGLVECFFSEQKPSPDVEVLKQLDVNVSIFDLSRPAPSQIITIANVKDSAGQIPEFGDDTKIVDDTSILYEIGKKATRIFDHVGHAWWNKEPK